MAGQAAIPKGDCMGDGERTIKFRMAGLAGGLIELGEVVADMAFAALNGGTNGFALMGFKRIALGFMQEFEGTRISQRGIQAAMVGVTGPAGSHGIGQVQGAVQPGWVSPLYRYIRVT